MGSRRRFVSGLGAFTLGCGSEVGLGDSGLATMRPEPVATAPNAHTIDPAFGPTDALTEFERRLYLQPDAFEPLGAPQKNWWRDRVPERGQTYPDFVISQPNWPTAPRDHLYLLPIGAFPTEFVVEAQYVALVRAPALTWLAEYISVFFGLPVTVMDPIAMDDLRVPTREHNGHEQFDAISLLSAVAARIPDNAYSMTTLINRDLFAFDEQEYAFGYGLHRERQAVMSFAQFDPMFMGQSRPENWERDIERRSLAVLSHEVAHTFGLRHCTYYRCVLNGVSHTREVDETPLSLCPICLRKLSSLRAIDSVTRYENLQAMYRAAGLQADADWVGMRLAHLASPLSMRR